MASENGITDQPSERSFTETLDRLEKTLQAVGMTIFARVDQSAAAQKVGLSLRPTQLLLFGDPRTGTPLMEAHPSLALDLPLKALVWQDASGQVWLSYNNPAFLRERHGLPPNTFQPVDTLIERALAPEA